MNREYITGKNSKRALSTVNPILQELWYGAMRIANSRKMMCPDFGCSSGLRTEKEQNALFKLGRDDVGRIVYPGSVVTNCDGILLKSSHQSGLAIDIFAISPGGNTDYRPESMALIATCFFEAASDMDIDMDWGGSFKSISDGAHIEIKVAAG